MTSRRQLKLRGEINQEFFPLLFLEEFVKNWYLSFKYLVEFSDETIWVDIFLFVLFLFLTTTSNTSFVIGL